MSIKGLEPVNNKDIEKRIDAVYKQYLTYNTNYEKYLFLNMVHKIDEYLFFKTVIKHVLEMLPICYTPTIADAVINYSKDSFFSDAIFLDINKKEDIRESIINGSKNKDPKIMIITDGEGILGIGDWGVQGVSIVTGKSCVYTIASSLDPKYILPVVIDAGTNNETLLNSSDYVGNKHKRVSSKELKDFVDVLIKETLKLYEDCLFHFEDFGRDNAASILKHYQDKVLTFNDDIQGTGVMIVSTMRAVEKMTNVSLKDHTFVIFGGGTAGIGIADQLCYELTRDGLSQEDAIKRFYIIDKDGLITKSTKNKTDGQAKYERLEEKLNQAPMFLDDVIKHVKPTVLIGTSGVANAFSESIIKEMAKHVSKPAIMPISNPTHLCEAKASDIINWTSGRAIVVTGSPSKDVLYNGITYKIGQANNALLYPGLGLGLVMARAKMVTDEVLSAAANAIISLVDDKTIGASALPSVTMLNQASKRVAVSVFNKVKELNLAKETENDPERIIKEYLLK